MTRVLVVDDHPIVVQGCRRLLLESGATEVITAADVVAGYRLALRQRPQALVTDLTFAGDDLAGLALIRRTKARLPAIRIMAFSMHNDPAIVSRALAEGASGYVMKDAPAGEFAVAFERLRAGQPHLAHDIALKVAMLRTKAQGSAGGLTDRESDVLRLLGLGYGFDRIAATLGVSAKTISNVTALIRGKLKINSLADLMRHARSVAGRAD